MDTTRALSALALAAGLFATACSQAAPQAAGEAATSPAASSGTQAQIRQLVGDAACNADSQCHALPLGAKACGGPESYIAWSSQSTDGQALKALGEQYHEQRQAQNESEGRISNCAMRVQPGAHCVAQHCQLDN